MEDTQKMLETLQRIAARETEGLPMPLSDVHDYSEALGRRCKLALEMDGLMTWPHEDLMMPLIALDVVIAQFETERDMPLTLRAIRPRIEATFPLMQFLRQFEKLSQIVLADGA